MRTFLRIFIVLVIVAGALGAAAVWWTHRAGDAANAETPVRVETVARGNLVEFVSAPGEVEPKTKVSISARVSARIAELPFKEGDKVTRGDPNANPPIQPSLLVRLDSSDLEASLTSTKARRDAQLAQVEVEKSRIEANRATITASRIQLADAERELNRFKELVQTKDISQQQYDQQQAKVDELKARILSAEKSLQGDEAGLIVMQHNLVAAKAEIDKAVDNLSYATIYSPIDGVVTRLNAEVGELVVTGTMNNAGTVILEVADLSQMVVNARVDEVSIASVKAGQKAKVRMEAFRDHVFEGTVDAVALANFDPSMARGSSFSRNQGNDGSRWFKTEILLDTAGRQVLSGLTADVDIETNRHEDVIKVPSQAVLGRPLDSLPADVRSAPEVDSTKATIPVVFRVKDGQAIVTPVVIGASDLTHTVIKAGLKDGDQIITGPYKVLEALQHNQKIKDERTAATQPATQPAARPW